VLDVLLAFWAAAWIWVGASIAFEIRGLSRLSDTVGDVGRAVERTGSALAGMSGLPLVGDRVREPAEAISAAGRSATESARESRASVRDVSVLLGVSIAVIPSVPVLLLYVPQRISLSRERRWLRRAVARAVDHGGDPHLEALLARRALENLPYHRLHQVSRDPEADVERGRHAALAAAELHRIGVRLPSTHRRP
jgi:hypothetical protein